jgi:hypothetical protein
MLINAVGVNADLQNQRSWNYHNGGDPGYANIRDKKFPGVWVVIHQRLLVGHWTVGCSDFHFFSYFWENLPFPLFLGTQEFRKCKKTNFSSAVLSEFFPAFLKICIFSELFKTIF